MRSNAALFAIPESRSQERRISTQLKAEVLRLEALLEEKEQACNNWKTEALAWRKWRMPQDGSEIEEQADWKAVLAARAINEE